MADSGNILVSTPECFNEPGTIRISSQVNDWPVTSNKEDGSLIICINFNQGFSCSLLRQNFLVSLEF